MTIKSFNETMGAEYADYFLKHGEEKGYKFILSTGTALGVLNSLYAGFVKDGIPPIEKLSKEKK